MSFYKSKNESFDELNTKLQVYTPAKSNFHLFQAYHIHFLLILHQYFGQNVAMQSRNFKKNISFVGFSTEFLSYLYMCSFSKCRNHQINNYTVN